MTMHTLKEHQSWIQMGIQLLVLFGGLFLFFSGIREDIAGMKKDIYWINFRLNQIQGVERQAN